MAEVQLYIHSDAIAKLTSEKIAQLVEKRVVDVELNEIQRAVIISSYFLTQIRLDINLLVTAKNSGPTY